MRISHSWLVAVVVFPLIAAACGGTTPPTTPPPTPSAEPAPIHESGDDNKGSIYGGSIAPVEVKKAMQEQKAVFRACYHALLEKNKKASGKVVLRFTVAEDGTVEEAVIMNATTLPTETAQCIADIVLKMQFAKPVGGKARITYPWEFTAE